MPRASRWSGRPRNNTAALYNADAETAKLNQKIAQFGALNRGVYVGDELVALNNLAQKRRDIDLDAKRMEIEEKQQSAVLADLENLIDLEQKRLATLAGADVLSRGRGKVLTIGAALGRHVSAGDTISSIVDCDKRFVVAIFSYRQGQSMMPGTRVRIDGSSFRSGIVSAVLPKTSDKVDERFAVPFPQTPQGPASMILNTSIKYWPAEYHSQSAIAAALSPKTPLPSQSTGA